MSETPDERREKAAIRRRWITLGEGVAVLAVLISAATLWNNYSERKSAEAERSAASRKEERSEAALVLRARAEDGGRLLRLEPVDGEQVIQSQRLVFPARLGLAPIETAGDARIEAGWIADALKQLAVARSSAGDMRVPVAIVSRFTGKGDVRRAAALYQLSYVREGHLLVGSSIRLRGLALVERVSTGGAQAAVDRAFKP